VLALTAPAGRPRKLKKNAQMEAMPALLTISFRGRLVEKR